MPDLLELVLDPPPEKCYHIAYTSFWLGTVGYIYVAALPNHKTVPNKTSNVEQSSSASPASAFLNQTPIVPKDSWKCPQCGRYNANYVGTCGCGTTKP